MAVAKVANVYYPCGPYNFAFESNSFVGSLFILQLYCATETHAERRVGGWKCDGLLLSFQMFAMSSH